MPTLNAEVRWMALKLRPVRIARSIAVEST